MEALSAEKKSLIEFLVNRCRTQIYTTGLPPLY